MAGNILIVLSNPVEGMDDDYNEWYNVHLQEVVELEQIVSARRFKMADDQPEGYPRGAHRYIAVYELAGEPKPALDELKAEVDAGRLSFPASFDQETLTGWAFDEIFKLSPVS
jgi:hypothetical protein